MQKIENAYIPLDNCKVFIINQKTDELEEISAIHSSLCEQSAFGVLYQKIVWETEDDVDQSCNLLDELMFNLQWLLSLSYANFWCQVINDKSIHACLDSYLRLAPRYQNSDWPQELVEKHSSLHRAIFMIFLRMSTLKESKEHFMTQKLFADLVYNNFLFDIPRMMDLCTLYNVPDNQPLLTKMISSLFSCQPRFFDDLSIAAQTISQILIQIEEKCFGSRDYKVKPTKLDGDQSTSHLNKMSETEFADIIYYISDTTKTLESFLVDIFTQSAKYFYKHDLIDGLVMVFSDILPAIREILAERERTLGFAAHFQLRCHVRQSRESLMKIVNSIVQNCVYLPVLDSAKLENDEETEELAERYFEILSSFLTHSKFFDDFCQMFNVKQDVINLNKVCPNIAEAHSKFLFSDLTPSNASDLQSSHPANDFNDVPDDKPSTSKDVYSERSSIDQVKMTSSVTSILDVLPNLEVDFVKSCLSYYEMNPEKVIQAIFEDNLPPHLATASKAGSNQNNEKPITSNGSSSSLKNQPSSSSSKSQSSSKKVDYLSDRRNIFDGDEFDIFAKGNKVDMSRVHFGKQNSGEISHWSKGDSDDVEKLKLLYNRYGLDASDTDNDDFIQEASVQSTSIYDDEYDDTYDDADVGANDADSVDELRNEKEKESEREEAPRHKFGRRDFVENPEVVRARAAERFRKRQEYFASRGGRANKHSRGNPRHNSSQRTQSPSNNRKSEKKGENSAQRNFAKENKNSAKQNENSQKFSSKSNKASSETNTSSSGGNKETSEKNQSEGATRDKKVDRKKTEHRQTRGGHSRKMLATKKASRGMFMNR